MEIPKEDKLLQNIMDNSVCGFGSREWVGADIDSDYDFIMQEEKVEKLLKFLSKNDINHKNINGSSSNEKNNDLFNNYNIKFQTNLGNIVNIIGYKSEKDTALMYVLNEIMLGLCKTELKLNFKNKVYRIEMVQALVRNLFDIENYIDPFEITDFDEDNIPF